MKIIFYNTKPYEKTFFEEKFKERSDIEAIYYEFPLLDATYIDPSVKEAQALSIFVDSYLTKEVLENFENLKYIFLRCVGYSNIDLDYCRQKGIKIFNARNYGNSTVAEYVFSLLLALAKKIIPAKKDLLDGVVEYDEIEGLELCHKTLGIIGLGAIGKKVQKIAKGFDMNVIVYDINKDDENTNYVELDELLEKSDFVTVNCPLTNETKGLIGEKEFKKMKKTAILINAARGEIVNTDELFAALKNKEILASGIDVIECEEQLCAYFKKCEVEEHYELHCLRKFLFVKEMMELDNVIVTPHNAYNTIEAKKRILEITIENINSSFDINPSPKNLVLI